MMLKFRTRSSLPKQVGNEPDSNHIQQSLDLTRLSGADGPCQAVDKIQY